MHVLWQSIHHHLVCVLRRSLDVTHTLEAIKLHIPGFFLFFTHLSGKSFIFLMVTCER